MAVSELIQIHGIFEEIIIVIALGIGGTIWKYLSSIKKMHEENQQAIEDLRKSVKIISGIFITYSKQAHPDLDIDHIKDMIEDSLEKH